jgi:hypothetical protein
MRGKTCSLHVWPGPTRLLDASKHPVATTTKATESFSANPPRNLRPDLDLYRGSAAWGFTWRGSWCGAPAAYVVVPLRDDPASSVAPHSYGQLEVPLTGSQLGCHGESLAVLIRGIPGGIDAPVQSPPAEWQGLRVSVSVPPAAAHQGEIHGIEAVVRNRTDKPLALAPCPDYELDTGEIDARGSETDSSRAALTPCDSTTVVPAHSDLRFALPPAEYGGGSPLGNGGARRGSRVTIWFAIAGLPTATATTGVR